MLLNSALQSEDFISERFSSTDVRAAHQDGWTSSVFSTYHKYETPLNGQINLLHLAKI